MNRLLVICCIWLFSGICSIDALADSWPKLSEKSKIAQCTEALQVAKAVFLSDSSRLFAPPEIPDNFPSKIVLKPQHLDISGGDDLEADQTYFDKVPMSGAGGSGYVYWKKDAKHGYRLAVLDIPHSWRGDIYSFIEVGEKIELEEFLAETRDVLRSPKFITIISDSWRPPLVFEEKNSSKSWIIDVGGPWQFLGDWNVYVAEVGGVKPSCTVQFRPAVKKAISLLPKPVQELARLLDQTIGPGENEGTLQPTARLRSEVEHDWANVAIRPWAKGKAYNTREEIDSNLRDWSLKGASYRTVYQKIQRQYPLAEQSLANYYQTHFHRSPNDAEIIAAYVLDVTFRSHYSFHSYDSNSYFRDTNAHPNPWKKN
jgi:hypothetical protein